MADATVKVRLFATLRKKYGVKELTVKCDGTLRGAIENASKIIGEGFLREIYDENRGKVKGNMIIMINGRNIRDLKEIKIKDGDVIAIFPPLAGG